MRRWSLTLVLAAVSGFGQTPDYPYVFKQFAGALPLGDGGPATQALLYNPVPTQVDSSGALHILDQSNFRIRKVASNGTIATLAETKVGGVSLAQTDENGAAAVTRQARGRGICGHHRDGRRWQSARRAIQPHGCRRIEGLTISFGRTPTTVVYGGLSPGGIGQFQFNIVVPDVPDGDIQIHFNVRGTEISQTAYLTVRH